MTRKKKPPTVAEVKKSDAELKVAAMRRDAEWWRDRANNMFLANAELEGADNPAFAPASAFLVGYARALYDCARQVDDEVTGDAMPF
jgi:hypothetical protein